MPPKKDMRTKSQIKANEEALQQTILDLQSQVETFQRSGMKTTKRRKLNKPATDKQPPKDKEAPKEKEGDQTEPKGPKGNPDILQIIQKSLQKEDLDRKSVV